MTNKNLTNLVTEALHLHRQRELDRAERLYQQILEEAPTHADALHLYGCLCDDLGRLDDAIALVTRAVKSSPKAYPYFYNLANMLSKKGELDEAVLHYRTAIRLKPDYAVAYNNLGLVLTKQGDRPGAKTCFEKAIQLNPRYADPHYNLGLEWKAEGALGRAIASYKAAIRIRPNYADAYYNLGNAYALVQRPAEAVAAHTEAARIRPDNPLIYTNLGGELLKLGRLKEGVAAFQEALRLNPSDVLTRSNLILAHCYMTSDPAEIYAQCEQWEKVHGVQRRGDLGFSSRDRSPGRRLRVGYVSADFRHHAAAYWIEPLFAAHQHRDFCIYCYSNSDSSDAVTDRLKRHADVWIECAELNDEALIARIQQDQIDILVDLSGHTDGNRLPVFARKPVPVQVSWFGFPVSTGLSAMDYRFSDAYMDPPGEVEQFYSEKLIRLQRFYAAFLPEPIAPPVGESPCVRNGYVTFASLNSLAKITPDMYRLWAKILGAAPNSHMLIQSAGLDDHALANSLRGIFEAEGIAASRLSLRGWTSLEQFLRLGQVADVVLDPFPFNGGVTSCQALWMGLPLVTMEGESAASRVGASLLSHMGLPHLVAGSLEQYATIAVSLSQDTHNLQTLRASMRDRMSAAGLLDGVGLAREVENAYRTMWQTWCSAPLDTV